jgi:hypothetical protein
MRGGSDARVNTVNTESDPMFGEVMVRIDTEAGVVEVLGPRIPSSTLRRTPGFPARPGSRMGCRSPQGLTLHVGDTTAYITPAVGGLTRRSYRVDALVDRVTYRLRPNRPSSSVLSRDGHRIACIWADHEGGVRVEWASTHHRPSAPAGLVTEQTKNKKLEPRDASVGYLLAAAYGTGAPARWELILKGLLAVPHYP